MDNTDRHIIEAINRKLAERGRSLDGRPVLRIVWSTDQIEKRVGNFTDWYGHIFVRTVRALREVPKYPHCKDRWVMEKLVFLDPENKIVKEELVDRKAFDYEVFYVFQDGQENPLPVTWPVVDMILYALEHGRIEKKNAAMIEGEEKEQDAKDVSALEERLAEQGRSPLFAFEESVFVDSTKRMENQNAASQK